MKQSGITRLFILTCIAVLFASYGVGLGVKQVRFAAADTEKPGDKPESDGEEVVAKEGDASESSEEVAAEPSAEPDEEVAARPERPEGRRGMRGGGMMGEGMRERFQNMSEEERAQMRERMGSSRRGRGGGEGRGGGAFSQLSDEDRESFMTEMREFGAGAADMSDEERQQARDEILEKYGLPTGGGGGGGRRGGGGAPPPKGRACFVPETPVWVDGKLVQIAKVTASQTIGRQAGGIFSLEQVQEHDGTFECRDIVLDSGNTIGVVDAHCFMLDSGQWIAAQNLTSGLRLKTLTGTVGITSVTKRAVPYTGKVYNLKVKNSDRYLVGKDVVIVRDY